jgi:hypothetical protein
LLFQSLIAILKLKLLRRFVFFEPGQLSLSSHLLALQILDLLLKASLLDFELSYQFLLLGREVFLGLQGLLEGCGFLVLILAAAF